jgi:hypothetical protein
MNSDLRNLCWKWASIAATTATTNGKSRLRDDNDVSGLFLSSINLFFGDFYPWNLHERIGEFPLSLSNAHTLYPGTFDPPFSV